MKVLSEAQQEHIKQKLIKYCKKEGLTYRDHGGAVSVYIPLTKM